MGTPGQNMIEADGLAGNEKSRYNRFGVVVPGRPGLISVADPYESYEGTKKINTPERVDLVVNKTDKTRLKIKYRTDGVPTD